MPIFSYKGIDHAGKKSTGTIDAESLKSARGKLKRQNIFPTELEEKSSAQASGRMPQFFRRVKVADLAMMTRQLATLVNANIPLVDALTALVDQIENPKLRGPLSEIREKVMEGGRLSDAMRGYPDVFNDLYVSMIAAGEASGAFDLVLRRLADFTESQTRLQSKVKGALTYPLIMGCVGTLLMVFLLVSVVPKITKVFEANKKFQLPLPTRVLKSLSAALSSLEFWAIVIVVVPLLVYLFRRYAKTEKGRYRLDRFRLKAPIFGVMFKMLAISRFSRTLATLMSSGVQLLPAMEISKHIVQNAVLARVIEETKNSVKEGESIAEPLKKSGEFPPMVIHMIAVGEKTGELEAMLERVADAYDQQVNERAEMLTTLLEPLMIVVMGAAVAFVVLSVLLPMLELNNFAR